MKIFAKTLVCGSLIAHSAFAQPLPEVPRLVLDEPSVGEKIVPVSKGEYVPFTGVLFSNDATAKITAKLKIADLKLKNEIERERANCAAKTEHATKQHAIDLKLQADVAKIKLDASTSENDVLLNRITQLENDKPNLILWVGGGLVVGATLTTLVVFVIK